MKIWLNGRETVDVWFHDAAIEYLEGNNRGVALTTGWYYIHEDGSDQPQGPFHSDRKAVEVAFQGVTR